MEALERVRQNSERLYARFGHGPASKDPYVPPRRDPLADRDISFVIQESLRAGAAVRLTARTRPPVLRIKGPLYEIKRERLRRKPLAERMAHSGPKPWTKEIWVPHWTHSGDMLKSIAWGMCLHHDRGLAVTVRLGKGLVERVSRPGFQAYVRDRITRELRVEFDEQGLSPPDYCFAIEAPEETEPHLQGAVTRGGYGPHELHLARGALRKAMKRMSGGWTGPSGKPSGRDVDIRELRTAVR
jgi:hypothetical protein